MPRKQRRRAIVGAWDRSRRSRDVSSAAANSAIGAMLHQVGVEWKNPDSARTILDQAPLNPACPLCNASIPLTIGQARKSPKTARCPNGHEVEFSPSDLEAKIRDLEKRLGGLFST